MPAHRPEPRPPIVTLLTDFGAGSGYPAQLKGVLLGRLPSAQLVDLSHEVPPFDLLAGALLLEACVPSFPAGTIHLAVVDPGVGTERRPIALSDVEGRRFVGPDNGLFTPFMEGARVHLLADAALVPRPASRTFHGRDLFAPVAAWLAAGGEVSRLGPAIDDPVRLAWPRARRDGAMLRGECLRADGFGNVVTSIRGAELEAELGSGGGRTAGMPIVASVAGQEARFVSTYGEGRPGELLALVGSGGRLEIAVREGRAADRPGVVPGASVTLRLG